MSEAYPLGYGSNGLLNKITYVGNEDTEISSVTYTYSGNLLTGITDKDGKSSVYSYTGNLLCGVRDVDGYRLAYTYTPGSPKRVASVSEYQGTGTDTPGGSITINYTHNQTTFTDHNGDVQVMQFNDWGNTISIQDGEGRAQYTQYALNKHGEAQSSSKKSNQLMKSSKLQNTVSNILYENSFETGNQWKSNNTNLTISRTTEDAYLGNYSLKVVTVGESNTQGTFSPSFYLEPGETVTFSAYVKNPDAAAHIAIHHNDGVKYYTFPGETLEPSDEWVRTEITYTNTLDYAVRTCAYLFGPTAGTYYLDCVQMEKTHTASRFDLIANGDFQNSFYGWVNNGGSIATVDSSAYPQLDTNAASITGNPSGQKYIYQTLNISGSGGDSYVLAGWAKGDSVPITSYDTNPREFGLKLVFNNTDGTKTEGVVHFNPDLLSDADWQYAATPAVAEKAYSSITVQLLYNYNANTVYFDGIQLYKEEFGSSYTYDDDGNVISVEDLQGQKTQYEYVNNNLAKQIDPNGAALTYTYDGRHNVLTATTATGIVYEFTYDTYGNNTSVSIANGTQRITSTAAYSSDGNRLVSTTDALGNTTTYGYNANTNVLEWVQYPEDTESSRTSYTYDSMYRLASASASVGSTTLSASYTYTNDLLTKIQTGSTTYNFTYGDFA